MSARGAIVVMVAGMLVAGCSGSDDPAADPTSAVAPSSSAAPTTVPDPTTTSTASSTTSSTSSTSTTTSTEIDVTDPATFSGDHDSDWCVLNRDMPASPEEQMFDPEALQDFVDDQYALAEQAVAVAPPELADEAQLLLVSQGLFRDAVAAADYDIVNVDLSALDDPEVDAALERIELYNDEVCGIDPDESAEFDPSAGTIGETFVASLVEGGFTEPEAQCILEHMDFTDPNLLEGDADAMAPLFDACGITAERLLEIGVA
jgi:hypothetical protein